MLNEWNNVYRLMIELSYLVNSGCCWAAGIVPNSFIASVITSFHSDDMHLLDCK